MHVSLPEANLLSRSPLYAESALLHPVCSRQEGNVMSVTDEKVRLSQLSSEHLSYCANE